ncbi:hypothetical protein FNV43_RR14839 [Rhamnella rubrinervis]|uniref:Uncharacterized protein n=1 Tax=Rhamnella rubrinervis TaxID=2594499 RepID=A0A8K0MGL5_9ROSA|nr:hypothetical protein FNV43_RR14839 [Rhamnella rubrinervis]
MVDPPRPSLSDSLKKFRSLDFLALYCFARQLLNPKISITRISGESHSKLYRIIVVWMDRDQLASKQDRLWWSLLKILLSIDVAVNMQRFSSLHVLFVMLILNSK